MMGTPGRRRPSPHRALTVDLHLGDCRDVLPTLPERSIHCCVTSPPYFGLRDYGADRQIGLEQTPDAFVQELVDVFRDVRRVLRDDGTLWLNLGDSYNAYNGNRGASSGSANQRHHEIMPALPGGAGLTVPGLKNKDLIGIPWRVAFALQADGWYLRQDIIWHKPNPMPESVRDRCTKAHEYIFLLSKGPRYYFDSEAIKEPAVSTAPSGNGFAGRQGGSRDLPMSGGTGTADRWQPGGTRNRRSVWTVATRPFKGAHFATFPPDLIEPCILAGAPLGGTVLDPFSGAGTTGLVCQQTGRGYVGVELNPTYLELQRQRLDGNQLPLCVDK
jgi:DNA modification methylase